MSANSVHAFAGEAFLALAQRYMSWLQIRAATSVGSLSDLHACLSDLQGAAIRLPQIGGDDDSDDQDVPRDAQTGWTLAKQAAATLPLCEYALVFDPLDEADRNAIVNAIEDDLGDIYNDLAEGASLMANARIEDAIWQWRFSYLSHWGRHAVHAQTALWQALANALE
ncbi:MAG: DUF5063 domain-containing protein [bacterium]|nr:DUF5063 domain-containing protein [bacterium]